MCPIWCQFDPHLAKIWNLCLLQGYQIWTQRDKFNTFSDLEFTKKKTSLEIPKFTILTQIGPKSKIPVYVQVSWVRCSRFTDSEGHFVKLIYPNLNPNIPVYVQVSWVRCWMGVSGSQTLRVTSWSWSTSSTWPSTASSSSTGLQTSSPGSSCLYFQVCHFSF